MNDEIIDYSQEDLDLTIPIFVAYVNVEGMSRDFATNKIEHYREYLSRPNVTMFIIASDRDQIELLWKGTNYMNSDQILEKEINRIEANLHRIYDVISEEITDDNIKRKLRKYLINDVLTDKH